MPSKETEEQEPGTGSAVETGGSGVSGFVSDPSGMPVVGTTVVGWARTSENPARVPLWSVRTDRLGIFTVDRRSRGPFVTVDLAVADHGVVPVDLVDGELPTRILVQVPARSARRSGCVGCGSGGTDAMAPRQPGEAALVGQPELYTADLGGCVALNTPDRSVDEYLHHVLVRVTQPRVEPVLPEPVVVTMPAPPGQQTAHERTLPLQAALRELALAGRGVSTTTQAAVREVLAPAQAAALRRETAQVLSVFRQEQAAKNDTALVRWDDDAIPIQAVTLAYGHLVGLRQRWVADGYSLGSLLYSLPLAPGQRKRIAVVDWRRRETAERSEVTRVDESLGASLQHDRDISEVVRATVSEQVAGASTSTSAGFGAGLGAGASGTANGVNLAAVLGLSGGLGTSSSEAWQDSSRSVLSSSLQQARDRLQQAATAVRGQRTTVVTSVTQEESVRTTSEVVANHNHCHAMTVQYFEVLRHLAVSTQVDGVDECLFVPMAMTPFDAAKALRWRDVLLRALLDPSLRHAFDSVRQVVENAGREVTSEYAEPVREVFGELEVDLDVPVPLEWEDGVDDHEQVSDSLRAFFREIGTDEAQLGGRPERWRAAVARAAVAIIDRRLRVGLVSGPTTQSVDLTVQPSSRATGIRVSFHGVGVQASRRAIDALTVGLVVGESPLPAGSRLLVRRMSASYRTSGGVRLLVDRTVNGDVRPGGAGRDAVTVPTPASGEELVNRHAEHQRRAGTVVEHLNAHLEHYHHAIWRSFDAARRHLILDSVTLTDQGGQGIEGAPSVASVVRNEVLAVVGNSLVMPAAPGARLGELMGVSEHLWADRPGAYALEDPTAEPVRISLPTGGVHAEAVLGACNACEVKDETRFWRWEESPIDDPDAISGITAESRATTPVSTTPTPMTPPVVAIQNAPSLPDPSAGAAAMSVLGAQGLFADAMGLSGTQEGARSALQQSIQGAQAFGQQASAMVQAQAAAARSAQATQQLRNVQSSPDLSATQRAQLSEEIVRAGAGLTTPADRVITAARSAAERGEITTEQRDATVHQALQSAAGAAASAPDLLASPTTRQAVREGGSVSASTPDGTRVAVTGPTRDSSPAPARPGGFSVPEVPEGMRVRWLLEHWRPGPVITYRVAGHEFRLAPGARVPSRLAPLVVLSVQDERVVLEADNANHTPVMAGPETLLAAPTSPDQVTAAPGSVPAAVPFSEWVVRGVHAVAGVDAVSHDALEVVALAHELMEEKRAGDTAGAKVSSALATLAGASPQLAALLRAGVGSPSSGDLPAVLAAITRAHGTGLRSVATALTAWLSLLAPWVAALAQATEDARTGDPTTRMVEARKKLDRVAAASPDARGAVEELWDWVMARAEDEHAAAVDRVAQAASRLADGVGALRELVRRLAD